MTGYSQTDSLKIPDLKGNPTEDKYDSIYGRYVQSREAEIRHLWKLNLADADVFNVNLGFEKKLGKSWSSDSYLSLGLPSQNEYYGMGLQWQLSHQLKYYYNLNRRERFGRKTNGFSANYFSIELFAGENRYPKPGYSKDIFIDAGSYYGVGFRYGWQRRIGKLWYVEPWAGIDYAVHSQAEYHGRVPVFNFNDSKWPSERQFYPVFGIKAGFAIESFIRLKNHKPANTLQQHTPDTLLLRKSANHLWKLNIVDLAWFMPNLGFEFRAAPNISLDSYLKLGVYYKPHQIHGAGDDLHLEHRIKYYLNLNSKPQQDNFCGDYLSLGFFFSNYSYYYDYQVTFPYYSVLRQLQQLHLHQYGLGIKYGLQRRIGNIGYFDTFIGIIYQVRETPVITADFAKFTKTERHGFVPVIGFRAGFAIGSGSKRSRAIK
jgi:hypothetical protein